MTTTTAQETKIWYVHDYSKEISYAGGFMRLHRRTLALRFNPEENQVEVGEAVCSPNDQFCKKTGRVKASGRLLGRSKSHYYIVYPSYPGGYQELVEKLGGGSEVLEGVFQKIVKQ